MSLKKKNLYFFITNPNELNLDYVKKTGAILILRHPERLELKILKKFSKNCKRKRIQLYISNNIKILFDLRIRNFYISAYNNQHYNHLKQINKRINIVGSAHNPLEINNKIKQGCNQIFLSRIFKTIYKHKHGFLGKIKFNLLTQKFNTKFVALGGINESNFSQLKNLNIIGCALSSDKKKAGNYIPAFFVKSFKP